MGFSSGGAQEGRVPGRGRGGWAEWTQNQLSGGKAHFCLDGEFGWGSVTLPGPQFYTDVGYEPSGSLLQLCESVYKDSPETRQSGS